MSKHNWYKIYIAFAAFSLMILSPAANGMATPTAVYGQWSAIHDPIGDQQGYTNPNYDAAGLTLVRKADTLNIYIQTHNPLDSASIGGYIDLDSDQNPATGVPSHYNSYPQFGGSAIGVDYYIDLWTYFG